MADELNPGKYLKRHPHGSPHGRLHCRGAPSATPDLECRDTWTEHYGLVQFRPVKLFVMASRPHCPGQARFSCVRPGEAGGSPRMPRRKRPMIQAPLLDGLPTGADPKTAFEPRGRLDGVRKARAKPILNVDLDQPLATDAGGSSHDGYGRKALSSTPTRRRQHPARPAIPLRSAADRRASAPPPRLR